ncbi:TetR/AcrR family transcriptional regulator [Endozoicomonas numazuensis]|uniref:TetR/AcrR family transcriptional regulator n=1 Tax=Endozoicomonas numazuensis TaxID=1137799 RepID=UPI00068B9CE6|nr:TetR/AcrR family transcriptional regulator [Endozoicomonas numazuensis]
MSAAESLKTTQSSKGTREIILDTAERLMAERGIDSVSLNEIVRESKQKNASALQYHFGNKEGLVQAIYDKHKPGIEQRREELFDQLNDNPDLSDIIEVLATPMIEEIDNPDGGMNYLLFISRIRYHQVNPTLEKNARQSRVLSKLSKMISVHLEHLPEQEQELRKLMMRSTLLHYLADYSLKIKQEPSFDASQRQSFKKLLINSITHVIEQPLN